MKENILLALVFIAVFIFGYFLMAKFDSFLENNHRHIKDEKEVQEPSYIMLSYNLTDDEIADEIKKYRQKNENISVVIYNSSSEDSGKKFSEEDVADS